MHDDWPKEILVNRERFSPRNGEPTVDAVFRGEGHRPNEGHDRPASDRMFALIERNASNWAR